MGLAERYRSVQERISRAALAAGRSEQDVELIVVTKTHPAQLVIELAAMGQLAFGENRDQEAAPKAQEVASAVPNAKWHFVGQLQTNKVKSVLRYASAIHSIDRPSLVKELAKQLENQDQQIDGFIELNLTDDENRGGVNSADLESLTEQVLSVPRIRLLGVMAVAGLGADPRQEFEKALHLSQWVRKLAPSATALSMGMSEDFEVAISLGATHIRVGSAITGPREYSA
jgi:pyridoxal phosphate enzyme (YggS family)